MDAYVIDTAALRGNVERLRQEMGPRRIYAVVKGDGYGLGLAQYSRFLMSCGVEHFAVSEPAEAQTLRLEGFEGEVLMLRSTSELRELKALLRAGAVCTVGSAAAYEQLDKMARMLGCRAEAHLYIDCGMGREGFSMRDPEPMAELCRREDAVCITGVYTHFPNVASERGTRRRFEAFLQVVAALRATGWQGVAHCAASCAALRFADMRLDAVRLGSALLGRVAGPERGRLGLQPVGYIDARIAAVQTVAAGQTLGYGSAWRAREETQVALLNVGYYHGVDIDHGAEPVCPGDCLRTLVRTVRRLLRRQRPSALVHGRAAPVLGRVAMQNTMLDVTGCGCAVGDRAILLCSPLMVRHLPREFI